MDTINTIKVTVEPTKSDASIKPESTTVIGDSDNPIEKSENKDNFSDTLKGEMENNESSQENVSSEEEVKDESGNNLPVDEEVAEEDEILPFPQEILEIITRNSGNFDQNSDLSSLQTMLQQINYGDIQTQSTTNGLIESETPNVSPNTSPNVSPNTSPNVSPNTSPNTSPNVSLNASSNASNGALYNTNYNILNQINNLNKNAANSGAGPEILKTITLGSKDGSKTTTNLNSLFSGSLTNLESSSVTGNILPGFDLSSNNQQNNSFNQQFSELQMRLLGQDKLINEATFDLAKLTQATTDIPTSPAAFETSPLNQPRTISELMIKTPVMDRQWSTEFNNHIAYISKSGGGNAVIKLNPAHLGPVEATIKVVNEVATIQIVASHVTTRDAMDAAIPRLKEMLSEQGFTQINVDISDKGFSKQSDKSNQGTSSANNQAADEEEGDFSNNESMTALGKSVINGVVDYFA